MRRPAVLTAFAILLLELAACASPGSAPQSAKPTLSPELSTPTESATAETTPAPSPAISLTPDPAFYGEQYFTIVAPYNDALCTFNAAFPAGTSPTVEEIAPAVAEVADAARAWADSLREADWPAESQDEIDTLVGGIAQYEAALRAAAAATTTSEFYEYFDRTYELNQQNHGYANAVRGALGIASVSGDPCD